MWERAKPMVDNDEDNPWRVVAQQMAELSKGTMWPRHLCTRAAAQAIGVSLEVDALKERFKRLHDADIRPPALRAKAIAAIERAMACPPPPADMTLWNFFQYKQNTVVNRGALAAKELQLQAVRNGKRRKGAPNAPSENGKRARTSSGSPSAPAEAGTPRTGAQAAPDDADDDADDEGGEYDGYFPGLQRGGKGGRGRGGAIQYRTKMSMCELVNECHVPISDVPKVLTVAAVALTGEVPLEKELMTCSHISDWITERSAGELYDDIAEFWSVRREFGESVVLHIGHDGTRRTDRDTGKMR